MRNNTNDSFERMDRNSDPAASNSVFTQYDYLRLMNDDKKKREYESFKGRISCEPNANLRTFNKGEFSDFIGTVFLEPILENVSYSSVAGSIANSISVDTGLTFKYREFEHFQRAQRGAEATEFKRTRGARRLNEVPFYTNGLRSYRTEEEGLDLNFDLMRLEMNTMGAAIALERDLLWVDSLYQATSGTNSSTFHNVLQTSEDLDLQGLHAVITYMTSPFSASTTSITLTNPFEGGTSAEQVEGLMKLGKFRATDVVLNAKAYWNLVNNTTLQNQTIWHNSRILDTGELQVPLLGVKIWKANIGYFINADDPESWLDNDDIYVIDRSAAGSVLNSKQPLQVRNWFDNASRVEDFMVFERVGFAVQNRRGLIRVTSGS